MTRAEKRLIPPLLAGVFFTLFLRLLRGEPITIDDILIRMIVFNLCVLLIVCISEAMRRLRL